MSVLQDELKVARETYRKDEELLEDPPNDFALEAAEGRSVFYLVKSHRDNEQVVIKVDLDEQPQDVEQEDDEDSRGSGSEDVLDPVPPLLFKVQISKGDRALVFECESDGEYVTISDLSMEQDADGDDVEDVDDDESSPYTGPPFDELDDTLQQAFLDYLEERGITAELCEYMRLFAQSKSDLEYQAWLRRVRDFVARQSAEHTP